VNAAFYAAGGVALISTFMVITRKHAVHALLYLVVSFLASAVVFYVLGAPFIAALEVIIYAGAIMVLFLFALMLLNARAADKAREREWLRPRVWVGPALLAAALLAELVYILATRDLGGSRSAGTGAGAGGVPGAAGGRLGAAAGSLGPKQVGVALFGPYLLGVELASMLLLAGLVGAHRLTQDRDRAAEEEA
jgi:NADH-quinone oxidoreductase subunit J